MHGHLLAVGDAFDRNIDESAHEIAITRTIAAEGDKCNLANPPIISSPKANGSSTSTMKAKSENQITTGMVNRVPWAATRSEACWSSRRSDRRTTLLWDAGA